MRRRQGDEPLFPSIQVSAADVYAMAEENGCNGWSGQAWNGNGNGVSTTSSRAVTVDSSNPQADDDDDKGHGHKKQNAMPKPSVPPLHRRLLLLCNLRRGKGMAGGGKKKMPGIGKKTTKVPGKTIGLTRRCNLWSLVENFFYLFVLVDLGLFLTRQTYFFTGKQKHLSFIQRMIHNPGHDGTYADNFQDTWVLRLAKWNGWLLFSGLEGDANPYFLDVGSTNLTVAPPGMADGKESGKNYTLQNSGSGLWCTNTRLLELPEHGEWNGACVEPFPTDFADRKCKLFDKVLGIHGGATVWFNATDRKLLQFGGTLQSTAEKPLLTVESIDFPQILTQSSAPKFIHLVSLGSGELIYDALERFPWTDHEVGVWIVRDPSEHLTNMLEIKGYTQREVANSAPDEYFVKDKYWEDSLTSKHPRYHPVGSWGC